MVQLVCVISAQCLMSYPIFTYVAGIKYYSHEQVRRGFVMAHFVAPAQFVAGDKMCTLNGTFCRTLHTLSPENDKMCSRSRHILSPLRTPKELCAYIQCYLAFGVWPGHYVRRSLTDLGNYTVS